MSTFNLIFYEHKEGHNEVKDFLFALHPKMRSKLFSMIELLADKDPMLREPYSKNIEDGIFELRCKFGSDTTRVMYFFYVGNTIVLTNGFVKKMHKTPKNVIDKAKKYRDEFLRKLENHDYTR